MSNRKRVKSKHDPNAPGGALAGIFEEWNDQGHLTPREYLASQMCLAILSDNHGSSAGLVAVMSTKVDMSEQERLMPPGGGAWIGAQEQMLHKLRPWERAFLKELATYREKPRGAIRGWAVEQRGYASRKTQCAFTVGLGVGVLRSLAEMWLPPVPS